MSIQIQIRRDTAANWTSANPTLAAGEAGYETDTRQLKFGNGSTAWTSLPYYGGGGTEKYNAHGGAAVGSTETINCNDGSVHRCILDENVTFTFSNPLSGAGSSFTLILVQDGSGTNTATWPASVDWPAGVAPTISAGAGEVTILTFLTVDGGTIWYGFTAGLDMS